jgi:hypothetical protein
VDLADGTEKLISWQCGRYNYTAQADWLTTDNWDIEGASYKLVVYNVGTCQTPPAWF